MTAVTTEQLLRFGAAVAVLVALGFLLIRLACGREMTRSQSWAFAPVVGAGACSLIEFAFRRPMFTVEFLLLLVLLVHAYATANTDRSKRRLSQPVIPALVLVFAFAAAWVLSDSVTMVDRLPNGGTDGWAIWNSHARFLYRDGPHWAVDIKNSFHPDYPLLVPLMSARIWRYAGDSTDLTGLWAVLFGLAGAALLTVTVIESRSVVAGVIAGVVLLGTPMYLQGAAGQEADVPLAVFYLATIALLMLASQKETDNSRVIALSGFTAGCAAWTKNEGILFLLATTLVMLAPIVWRRRQAIRRFGWFSSGFAVPVALLLLFKATSVAPTDLFQNRRYDEIVAKIFSPERYRMIFASVMHTIPGFGHWAMSPFIPLLIFLLIRGIDWKSLRSAAWISCASILAIVSCGYLAIYVITPMDLKWHLESSLDRLMLQLWPSILLLSAYATRNDEPSPVM